MIRVAFVVLLTLMSSSLFAQNRTGSAQQPSAKDSEGKEFWVCFMRNYREVADATAKDQLTLQLFFTSNEDARVRVEIEGLSFQQTLLVNGGTVTPVSYTHLTLPTKA